MAQLDYIDMIGVDTDTEEDNTEVESNSDEEQSQEDFVQDSEDAASESDSSKDTVPSETEELRKQVEVLEKRNKDKDDFINELREQAKAKEPKEEVNTQEEELDYWDDPEAYNKKILDKLEAQEQKLRIQEVQIKEGYYAQTVDGYFDIVNQESLREAVSADQEFAKEFNQSIEPYKTAYEYLKNRTKSKEDSINAEVERRLQERLAKAGIKEPKKAPPNINKNGSSNSEVSLDEGVSGFESFFGNR